MKLELLNNYRNTSLRKVKERLKIIRESGRMSKNTVIVHSLKLVKLPV